MTATDSTLTFEDLVRHMRRAQAAFFAAAKGRVPEHERRVFREAAKAMERQVDRLLQPEPTDDKLNDLVGRMRKYQNRFFAHQRRDDLLAAKDYERRIDALLVERAATLSLFAQGAA